MFPMTDCPHNPILLDDDPLQPSPALVVCSLCGDCLEGVSFIQKPVPRRRQEDRWLEELEQELAVA